MQLNKTNYFSMRNTLWLVAVTAAAAMLLMYWTPKKSFEMNAWFTDLQNLFQQPAQHTQEVIKIVDEQSQVIDVVKKASPAVVSIVASAEVPRFETFYDQDPFFGFRIPQQRQNGTEIQRVGAGTGFLVSADGYIVTNKHVVDDERAEYTVYLNTENSRGEKLTAKVLARHPDNDLAVLKIEKNNLPFLSFGDSDALQVGQTAVTIGYALGEFDNTVSKGVVSGLSRNITAGGVFGMRAERLTNLIQTDAAINPGNSGGPMLDLHGNVIGVNVAMASGENIGFALPGNTAKDAFEQVQKTGTIAKKQVGFLGVRYVPITETFKNRNQLPFDYGVLVSRGETAQDLAVIPGSPADKSGIVENDILLEVNGKKIDLQNTLADLIARYKPNDTVTLKVYHRGETKDVRVTLSPAT